MSHAHGGTDPRSPWPGPRPYHEHEAHLFQGRRLVVDQLLNDAVYGARISLLCAESGSGKTSLLVAGLLPELRQRRALRQDVPPTILLREWGSAEGQTVEERLASALRGGARGFDNSLEAIDMRIQRKSQGDAEGDIDLEDLHAMRASVLDDKTRYLKCVDMPAAPDQAISALPVINDRDPIEIAQRLCQEFGCIFLILDQLEELMGTDNTGVEGGNAHEVADVVGRLFRDCPEVQLVLAWRTEFYLQLVRHLNRFVTNLSRRLIDLERLPSASVLDVIRDGAMRLGHDPGGSEIDSFVEALRHLGDRGPGMSAGASLLELQAVLSYYYEWHTAQPKPPVPSEVSLEQFLADRGVRDVGEQRGHSLTPQQRRLLEAAKRGLDDFVEKSIAKAASAAAHAVAPGASPEVANGAQLMARWIVYKLVHRLATEGGFKQHARIEGMLSYMLNEAGRGLGVGPEILKKAQAALSHAVKRPGRRVFDATAWSSQRMTTKPTDGTDVALGTPKREDRGGLLAEIARSALDREAGDEQRSSEEGAMVGVLLDLAVLVLANLKRAFLLKESGENEQRQYELVHDGFARPLMNWRDNQSEKSELSLGSPVPIRGEQFRWTTLGAPDAAKLMAVTGLRWIGVSLGQAVASNKRVRIENVEFTNCILTGTYFANCTFVNVIFRGCTLAASVFDGTRVRTDGKRPETDRVATFEKVSFEACDLRSCAFKRCTFGDGVRFVGNLGHINDELSLLSASDETKTEHQLGVCDLTTVSFTDCSSTTSDAVVLQQCIVRFAQISDTEEVEGRLKLKFDRCDLINAWVQDAGLGNVDLDARCRTIGMLSYQLPLAAWLDRGKGTPPNSRST